MADGLADTFTEFGTYTKMPTSAVTACERIVIPILLGIECLLSTTKLLVLLAAALYQQFFRDRSDIWTLNIMGGRGPASQNSAEQGGWMRSVFIGLLRDEEDEVLQLHHKLVAMFPIFKKRR